MTKRAYKKRTRREILQLIESLSEMEGILIFGDSLIQYAANLMQFPPSVEKETLIEISGHVERVKRLK